MKAGRSQTIHDLDFEEERSEEFVEFFEWKDCFYENKITNSVIRLYARTWKFGKDPQDKSHLWKITIQPVDNAIVLAETPILVDWCEKDKIKDYIKNSHQFADYKELSSPPKRKKKVKKS